MKPTITHSRHNAKNQQGIVLVVALLILLVMTILGISMLSSSTMEERMASNIQAQQVTFQAAESCIRTALLPPARALRDGAINNTLLVNPNPSLNCQLNGVNATVNFSISAVAAQREGDLSGFDLGNSHKQVDGAILFMTGTSTLPSGTSSSVTFVGKSPKPNSGSSQSNTQE